MSKAIKVIPAAVIICFAVIKFISAGDIKEPSEKAESVNDTIQIFPSGNLVPDEPINTDKYQMPTLGRYYSFYMTEF